MNLKPQRTLLLVTLAAFLAACNLASPVSQLTSGTSQNEQLTLLDGIQRKTILPATYQQQVQQKQQTITFPNMVTTSELAEPPTEDISEVEAELKAEGIDLDALDAESFSTQSLNKRLHFAQFLTQLPRKPRPYQVKVPANGQFKLTLQEGTEYAVLDNDATDGQAKIQLPAGTLKTWLHLDKNWRKNSELQVEDSLYYVNDTLSSAKKKWFDHHRWLKLGLRPMPVPSDWHSTDGNAFVLNFTAKDVSGFDMVWLNKKNKQAAFPPGIQEIGPVGGTVELPGVAKLEIPENALQEKKLIRLSQEKEVPELISEDFWSGEMVKEWDYSSAVLRAEPLNLQFDRPVTLYLQTDLERLGNNNPSIMYLGIADELGPDSWDLGNTVSYNPPLPEFENWPADLPLESKRLGYFTKLISANISPDAGMKVLSEYSSTPFIIQQVASRNFYLYYEAGYLNSAKDIANQRRCCIRILKKSEKMLRSKNEDNLG